MSLRGHIRRPEEDICTLKRQLLQTILNAEGEVSCAADHGS
jgi:hypothetical protein